MSAVRSTDAKARSPQVQSAEELALNTHPPLPRWRVWSAVRGDDDQQVQKMVHIQATRPEGTPALSNSLPSNKYNPVRAEHIVEAQTEAVGSPPLRLVCLDALALFAQPPIQDDFHAVVAGQCLPQMLEERSIPPRHDEKPSNHLSRGGPDGPSLAWSGILGSRRGPKPSR